MYRFQAAGKILLHLCEKGNHVTFTGPAGPAKIVVAWYLENRSRFGRKLSQGDAVRGPMSKWRQLQSYLLSTGKYVTLLNAILVDSYNCASSLKFGDKRRLFCRPRNSPIYYCRMLVMKASDHLNSSGSDSHVLKKNSVRTPLNHIINYLEMALDGPLDIETRDNLSVSHAASKVFLMY